MSTDKPNGIPLATLLEPDKESPPRSPGVVMTLVPNRNLHMLMGEKNADPETARLRQAIARELLESRETTRQRAINAETALAPHRGGRSSGLQREEEKARRDRVRELGIKHPTLSSLKLYRHQDARSLRDEGMTAKRFANILSEEAPRRGKRTV